MWALPFERPDVRDAAMHRHRQLKPPDHFVSPLKQYWVRKPKISTLAGLITTKLKAIYIQQYYLHLIAWIKKYRPT
jgi:hypothetical protein